MGLIESAWYRDEDGVLTIKATVPFDTEAQLYLPDAEHSRVEGIAGLSREQVGERVRVYLSAGTYTFRYIPSKNYDQPYSIASPIEELMENSQTRAAGQTSAEAVCRGGGKRSECGASL